LAEEQGKRLFDYFLESSTPLLQFLVVIIDADLLVELNDQGVRF